MGRMQYAPTEIPNMPFRMIIFQIKKKVIPFYMTIF